VKYVLDTHAAIWLLEGKAKLGARARAALEQEERESVALAGISLLEIAMLAARNVIALTPNAQTGLRVFADKLTVLPIDSSIAADAVTLALPQRRRERTISSSSPRIEGSPRRRSCRRSGDRLAGCRFAVPR
jgi:PIN domain nuclease of toxin-antitoxin system